MSTAGSIGTSRGMRMWYMRKPKCTYCPKKDKKGNPVKPKVLFKHGASDIRMCSGCFRKLTGEKLADQWWLYIKTFEDPKKSSYEGYIKWVRNKIEEHKKKDPS